MYWLSRLFRKQQTERELDSELRFHLEQRIADLVEKGASRDEAMRQARLEFGGVEAVKEECRESRRVHFLETLLQDLRYALRTMRRSKGFTAVAVLTLALGIGANTAIFSVVNGVLINPLPFPHPDELVALHESKLNFERGSISYPNFLDWQRENHSFSAMAVFRNFGFNLTGAGDAEQVRGLFVSSDFFDVLGITPALGRTLERGEDAIGGAPLVMIHHGLWQRKFGGSADILGKTMTLDGREYTIIGVIPPVAGLDRGFGVNDVYLPFGQWNNPLLPKRTVGLGIHGVGRLKPGVNVSQARADMEQITRGLATAYPDEDKGIGATLVPLRQQILGPVQQFLIVLLAAVGFVLLIACVNVANLLLARSSARTSEFAIRVALGASQSRLVRQLLTESVLLAAAGGALGLGLAAWGEAALVRTLPDTLPRATEIRLDAHVLVFTMLISLLSGILFGLAPAMKISKSNVLARMRFGGLRTGRARNRAQNALVVAEIAMAVILLASAGLMIRTLGHLWTIDPGFDTHHVLTFGLSLPPSMSKATPQSIRAAYRQIDTRLASVPGVEAGSFLWGAFPLQGDDEALFWLEGRPRPSSPNDMNWTLRYVVSPDYLKTMGISLLRGRFIAAHDDEHSPHVVAVDEVFATKFFPNEDPVGKRINLDDGNDHSELTEIVGLVRHVKQWGLDSDDTQALRAQMYVPFMQLPDPAMILAGQGTGVAVRGNGDPNAQFDSIRTVMRQMNAEQVVYAPRTMEQIISDSISTRRYSMFLLGGFAALALLLASVGIYGVVSYVAGQRTQEIGIRMALGASRMDVLRLVIRHGAWLILTGLVIGIAAALAITRLMATLLFGVSTSDPLTFAAVGLLLAAVALAACSVPARRAMRVDPMIALRYE
ncbi:MAG TPA: ABC transporter permease [Candidatus Angelobacter sp.]|nr:ABC transporter permease [Candidatus Angelobacter sp.]